MNSVEKYCKAVGKGLVCLGSTKKKLLNGLKTHLEQYENLEEYGSVEETIQELQQDIPEEEIAKVRHTKKIYKAIIATICAVLLVATVIAGRYAIHTWRHAPVYYTSTIEEE